MLEAIAPRGHGLPQLPKVSALSSGFMSFARGITPCNSLMREAEKESFRAAYLVVNRTLYYNPGGHMLVMSALGEKTIEDNPPSHYGWFKIMPHPGNPRKKLFVFDAYSDYNNARRDRDKWDLASINEYYSFFYVVLLKSGIDRFSLRFACHGKRAAGINNLNWRKESGLLFPDEKIEELIIGQIRSSLNAG